MASVEADVVVAEAGASPLEPYNGAIAIEEIGPNVRCTVLCASDPYAVSGVITAFRKYPDLVAGLATSTEAGIELVEKLSCIEALNILEGHSVPKLRAILEDALGFRACFASNRVRLGGAKSASPSSKTAP